LSGDTVVLVGSARGGAPAPEMQVGLSHLVAPKVARHPDAKDEPGGWPVREFVRLTLVGKQVRFRIDFRDPRSGRGYATLWLTEAPAESVNVLLARHGMARVNAPEANRLGTSPEYADLLALGRAAEAAGTGIFNPAREVVEATVRTVQWSVPAADAPALAEELGKSEQAAIVEGVMNGSTMRVLLTSTAPPLMLQFQLAGVIAPKAPAPTPAAPAPAAAPSHAAAPPAPAPAPAAPPKKVIVAGTSGSKPAWGKTTVAPAAAAAAAVAPAAAEPVVVAAAAAAAAAPAPAPAPAAPLTQEAIGAEAKNFVESRLLQRDVTLHITGVDRYGNFVGRLEYPGLDVAVELLKAGLARVADFSITQAGASAGTLFAATTCAESFDRTAHCTLLIYPPPPDNCSEPARGGARGQGGAREAVGVVRADRDPRRA